MPLAFSGERAGELDGFHSPVGPTPRHAIHPSGVANLWDSSYPVSCSFPIQLFDFA